jgi:hypothetical protein
VGGLGHIARTFRAAGRGKTRLKLIERRSFDPSTIAPIGELDLQIEVRSPQASRLDRRPARIST